MTERLTNLATSTLTAPITNVATQLTVLSPTRFPSLGDFRIRVDSELMLVTVRTGSTFTVTRGIEGTTAAAHLGTADVRHVISTAGLDLRVKETMATLRGVGGDIGYASLGPGGTVPPAQLPASVVEYKGAWNASTNTPTLSDATGLTGDQYSISVAATRNLGSGSISWTAGEMMIHNGSIWQQTGAPSSGVAGVNQIGLRTGSPLTGNVDVTTLIAGLVLRISDIVDTSAGDSTSLATVLGAKADDTDLAAKADATDLTIIGPRKSLNNLGTPYLLGTDSTGTPPGTYQATDIGCVFDSSVDSVLRIPLHGTEPYPETSWFVARNIGNAAGLTLRVEMASTGTGIGIQTPLQVGTNPNSVEIPPNGSCQFTKRAAGSDIWMASGDHTL